MSKNIKYVQPCVKCIQISGALGKLNTYWTSSSKCVTGVLTPDILNLYVFIYVDNCSEMSNICIIFALVSRPPPAPPRPPYCSDLDPEFVPRLYHVSSA